MVSHLLTVDQKQRSYEDCERYLELFRRDRMDLLRRYMTMNGILIPATQGPLGNLQTSPKVAKKV